MALPMENLAKYKERLKRFDSIIKPPTDRITKEEVFSPEILFQYAKSGNIYVSELNYAINKVQSLEINPCDSELYNCLFIVGLMGSPEHTKIIIKFLHCPEDPMLSALALKILCIYWQLSENYLNEIKQFINGVEWDELDDIRTSALRCGGEYLKTNDDDELLKLIYDVFINEIEDSVIQESAYSALAMATGQTQEEYLNDEKPNADILSKVQDILSASSKL